MNKKLIITILILLALIIFLTLVSCTGNVVTSDPQDTATRGASSSVTAPVALTAHPNTIYFPKVPGAINPNVTQANIKSTVCVSGWTKTIRPPASYTTKLKIEQMAKLGLTGSTKDYEEDHLISLEIGGNPTDPNNLWPEPWNGPEGAHRKDVIETRLKRLVCNGTITLAQAQSAISSNWEDAYAKYVPDTN